MAGVEMRGRDRVREIEYANVLFPSVCASSK
jgi:hypothetical protein